jgi:hypothetical protein
MAAADLYAGSPSTAVARGMVVIHSCPPALRPHIEWAVADVLGAPVRLDWRDQPVAPSQLCAQTGWLGRPGTAGRLATRLRDWPLLRAEITEDPSPGCDGERIALTPDLGLWRGAMSANGDVLVQEDRLRAVVLSSVDAAGLHAAVDGLLGKAWDDELDVYRRAADGTPMRWLSAV